MAHNNTCCSSCCCCCVSLQNTSHLQHNSASTPIRVHHELQFMWVYWDQLDANCLVLFYYTFFTLHVSDVIHIHPQERHIMHMQSDTGKCTCLLTRWKLDTSWNGSTNTCTYLYQTACALYDAPEDGCILHPKHVE